MARSRANTRTRTKRSSTARPSARRKPSANKAEPVAASEFEAALDRLNVRPPFAVAVSGGADSLALMLLAADWCKRRRAGPPLALTVDHGLRKESAREAAQVSAWAKAAGVPHRTLKWDGPKPEGNVQALARDARYRLIAEAMRGQGIAVLLTGHTEDDQAETFLLRLARGSGLDGLSGMAEIAPYPLAEFVGLKLARPLLGFSHDRLIATLKARKQKWIADPSNENERFARVQVRNLLPALAEASVTRERIADAAHHLRRAREAIDVAVAHLVAEAVELSPWGYALIAPPRFANAPAEVALRALSRLLETLGGGEYPPRFEQTEAILAWLAAPKGPTGRTLGGCRLMRRPDGRILFAREEGALASEDPCLTLEPGQSAVWDRRFLVTLLEAPGALDVRALGARGLKLAGRAPSMPPIEPRRIAATGPGIWRDGHLVAAPLLGFESQGVAVSARFVAPQGAAG